MCTPRHRPLLHRFYPPVPFFKSAPLWIHACSVGEVGVARQLIRALNEQFPAIPILLTVSTITGMTEAQKRPEGAMVTWFPFDQAIPVRCFFRRLRPRLLVLVETELWPNTLEMAARNSIPVALVNGRFSDRHVQRYHRSRRLFTPVLEYVSCACMQSESYAKRAAQLGIPKSALTVTGNMKFDGVKTAGDDDTALRLRREIGIPATAPVLVFGSTRPGDEVRAAQCYDALRKGYPDLRLIVAPRHVQRAEEVAGIFEEKVRRRSSPNSDGRNTPIFLLDTLGELNDFYAVATVAVVGGSFDISVNGHNPIEPAAQGVPVVFGPYMGNFEDPARALLDAGGARQVADDQALLDALRELLGDTDKRAQMATAGQNAVRENQGATMRTVECLMPYLEYAAE